jgi:putative transposase
MLAPLMPRAERGSNKRHMDRRSLVKALLNILCTGYQWRAVPNDFPPRSTLFGYFQRRDCDFTIDRVHPAVHQQ